jgi:EAL domain-containing protein (putative c-di-GMP-specific phosphodiesterase class I)
MQRSEVALRVARSSHRNHLLYSAKIDDYQPERIALVGELPDAIERNQLLLHYQPKIDLNSGRIVGVEALVRWQHPQRGLVFPDKFIPMAERTQIINPLTRWVIQDALRQVRIWRDAGFDLGLSVNLSTRNLLDTALCESIPDMAGNAGVPLDRLTLEITESAIMGDPEQCKRLLDGLHARGVVFSMDDFGIGQSSLSYIKDLPIHKIKIDKSFVMGFKEPRNAAIVHAAIDMGHSLEMQVTAEGVEDEQTLKVLKAFGCDIGQGYFFSKPLPVDKMTGWFRESAWGYKPADRLGL